MLTHFRHINLKSFPMVWRTFQSNEFWPLKLFFWKFGSSLGIQLPKWIQLGNVWVLSLTFSYTPGSMKCDPWASLLARTFASPYFGCKPKAKVMISLAQFSIYHTFITSLLKKLILYNENCQINHIISKHGSNYVKGHGSIYLQLS